MEGVDDPNGNKALIEDVPRNSRASNEKTYVPIIAAEDDAVEALMKNYMKSIDLHVKLEKEVCKLEKRFEEDYNVVYAERKAVLDKVKESQLPGIPSNSVLKIFWLIVLKRSLPDSITAKDEDILKNLTNLRSVVTADPIVKFDLIFEFSPNKYFDNAVLTKTYFWKCAPDPKYPLGFEGAEIFKCEGSKICWKHARYDPTLVDDPSPQSSFFNFFSPPNMPKEDDKSAEAIRVRCILKNDYKLGCYIKERIIPKAILFFTGDAIECGSDYSFESEGDDRPINMDKKNIIGTHEKKGENQMKIMHVAAGLEEAEGEATNSADVD